jgi:hypothetical protein
VRRRPGLIAAGLLLLTVVVLAALGSGRDGAGATASAPVRLAWRGEPLVIKVPELPRDRILSGEVRNTSVKPVDLSIDRVRVVDAQGREVQSSVRFLAAFAHGLYPPTQKIGPGGTFTRTRLGEITRIKPGAAVPMTLSWRVPAGADAPVEVRFGGGSLPLPD